MGVFSEIDMDRDTDIAPFDLDETELKEQVSYNDGQGQDDDAEILNSLKEQHNIESEETKPPIESEDDDESGEETPPAISEEQKKKEFEAQEAKRKADWVAKQAAKQEAELMAWEDAVSISDETLIAKSVKRIGDETERLTQHNMKTCVAEYIQTKCIEDMAFSRQVMHPRKNMVNCFKYINRQAVESMKQSMKDNDEKPINGIYGEAIAEGICYKWAEDYFNDLEAVEDHVDDEKFEAKSYYGGYSKSKKAAAKKPAKKTSSKVPVKKETVLADNGQLTLEHQISLEDLAS